jgi:hypothetical protein
MRMSPRRLTTVVFATGRGKTRVLIDSLARLLDVGSVLETSPKKAEHEAMADDWLQVGENLRAAMGEVERELPEQQRQPEQLELVEAH